MTDRSTERGMALLAVTMTLVLVLAISAALTLSTSSEALIAANFRGSQQALYAAEAAAEWALVDLPAVVADWPTLLTTAVTSGFVDGVSGGNRTLSDGSLLDLNAVVQRNAAWKPYAYGPLQSLLPEPAAGLGPSPFYIAVFVADDPVSSTRLRVMAEAFGPRGSHKTLELTVFRDAAGVHLLTWAERR